MSTEGWDGEGFREERESERNKANFSLSMTRLLRLVVYHDKTEPPKKLYNHLSFTSLSFFLLSFFPNYPKKKKTKRRKIKELG